MKMSQQAGSNPSPQDYWSNALTTRLPTAAAEPTENLWYLCTVLNNVYVASPDPNPRGGGQLPNPKSAFYANEWNQWGIAPTYTTYAKGGG